MPLKMLFIIAVTLLLSTGNMRAFAADGPENTGSLMLDFPKAEVQTSTLQLDRNVVTSVFGDDAQVAQVIDLIKLQTKDGPCDSKAPSIVDEANVVAAVLAFDCKRSFNELTVSLGTDALPPGFTLGVRTPYDHFVLSANTPSRATITDGVTVFFRAGLQYVSAGDFLEHARIGRAHALYFGGLAQLPAGIWIILMLAAIAITSYSFLAKILISIMFFTASSVVASLVIKQGASLSLIPVRTLSFISLSILVALCVTAYLPQRASWYLQALLLACLSVLNGLEHAVILRWIEGQSNLSPWSLPAMFFLGIFVIAAAAFAIWWMIKTALPASPSRDRTVLRLTSGTLAIFAIYTAGALALKLT